jgi:GNAT superfamily N-acetyltransferase
MPYDFSALESIEYEANTDLYRAAPPAVQAALAIEVRDIGAATCLTCRGIEPATIFRRAIGLGVGRAATEAALDDVIAYMNGLGQRYAVPVAPGSQPPELGTWLERRGFAKGYAWMKFSRLCTPVPKPDTDLEIKVVDASQGDAFGRVAADGFGLAPAVGPWIAALPGRPDWVCVMAFAGSTPVATGAMYVKGGYAWLGFGATLASHRRHGAQAALLARRITEAAAHGARVAVTETGERLPDKPSNSYRNILRAGFEEAYLRQNYLSPVTPASAPVSRPAR